MSELRLNTDGHIIKFGADNDVSLTHVADAGLLLNSTMKLQFNDATQFVQGTSATVLSIGATDEIDLTATAVDLNGTLDVSGASQFNGAMVLAGTTPTLTIGDAGAEDSKIVFDGNAQDFHIGLDDTDDSLKIGLGSALGTTAHIVMDATGAVTKPLQPAFSVTQTTGISAETVNDGTTTTIGLNAEQFDINGDFLNSVFTAPVTGKYQISGRVVLDAGTSSETKLDALNMHFVTSNRNYYITAVGTVLTATTDQAAVSGSVLADMDANDTLTLQVYCKKNGATTATTTVQTGNTNTYGGCYLTGYLAC